MATTTADTGKPGTNWKQVTPAHRRKISAIVNHYMKKAHPFDACVRDNRKRFGDRAEKVCAVVKDMGERTTKWRKGGKGKRLTEAATPEEVLVGTVFDEVLAPALDDAGVTPDELAGWVDDVQAAGLLVEAAVEPEDFTVEQLEAEAPAAQARLATLERLGLTTAGAGAVRDRRLVEASAYDSPSAARAALRHDRAALKRARKSSSSKGSTSGKYDESKHPRGFGGKWIAKGASGREVRAVQRRVGARVDGDFGDKTKAAVERFQRQHGLKVDGIVGRQTVAALRGRKDAKRVSIGALSARDRAFLLSHVHGQGRRKRVVEAVAVGSFLDRVKQLEPGEIARLADGSAVRHHFTDDGREVWSAGQPMTYYSDGERFDWSRPQRTPEEAVSDAFTSSAASTDPDSIGGGEAWTSYTPVKVNGRDATFRGVNAQAQPLVRYEGDPYDSKTPVSWPTLTRAPRLVEATYDESKHPRDKAGKFRKLVGEVEAALKRNAPLSERRALSAKVRAHEREHGTTMGHAKLTDLLHDNPGTDAEVKRRIDEARKAGPRR